MTAITAARSYTETAAYIGHTLACPMLGTTGVVYGGALVIIDEDGFATDATDAASVNVAGVARYSAVNEGADGAVACEVVRGSIIGFAFDSGVDATLIGQLVYLVDNVTVGALADTTNGIAVGQLISIDGLVAYVAVNGGITTDPTP